ncbi:hypothetical protein OOZ54_13275 [Rhodopseudomonas palustris]|uniref:hypothetical protein n=1 Tax=Rhodopseudomonas palustris TaxID=1076 RepID=UPI0022F033FD|nr:hypothetical protein [Rhodopseudomonas palustris]WBU27635.1 hypothetical protein OOZ54_13275 [Rhodopseudomonas palustris]
MTESSRPTASSSLADPKRERIVKAAVEWVYDQSCSHALAELEDAVTDFMGHDLDRGGATAPGQRGVSR